MSREPTSASAVELTRRSFEAVRVQSYRDLDEGREVAERVARSME
jgi:hypothetical protein